MKKYFPQKLKMPKTTISLIIGVAYIISIIISGTFLTKVIKSHDNEVSKLIAADVYDALNNEFVKAIIVSRTIASDNFLKQNLKNEADIPPKDEVALIRNYLRTISENFSYNVTFVVSDASKNYYYDKGFHRVIDPENQPSDIWYKKLVEANVPYKLEVDPDELDRNLWNIYINSRIEDENKNLLGACGVGIPVDYIQQLLSEKENQHNIKIDLFNFNENYSIDSRSAKFKDPALRDIVLKMKRNPEIEKHFILNEFEDTLVIARNVPEIGTYLVIRRNSNSMQGMFSSLMIQMALSFIAALLILMYLVQRRLQKERQQIEEAAKKYGMASHADKYVSMHLIDLKAKSIYTLSRDENYNLMNIEDGNNVIRKIKDSFIATVEESTLKPLLDFINLKNLPERLKTNHAISQEFLSKHYGWCKANFILVDNDESDSLKQVIFAIELIQETKQKEKLAEDFKIRSETDLMTGLKNRGGGEKAIRELMAQGEYGMFCLMDADKFKSINDNYGHGVGDKVIIAIANCLKTTFRTYDITMRLGGDEFAVFAVGIKDDEIGKNVVNRLFRKIDDILIPELGDRRITISLGSALFDPNENIHFEELYKRADLGTYESKKVQGNYHTCYSPELKNNKD